MKITREELLKKAQENHEHPSPQFHPEAANSWEDGVIAGAKTVGFEVLDKPELPERLVVTFGDPPPGSFHLEKSWLIDSGEPRPRYWQLAGGMVLRSLPDSEMVLRELVLRYNAKEKVLNTMRDLEAALSERLQGASDRVEMYGNLAATKVAIYNVRAAYDKEKP